MKNKLLLIAFTIWSSSLAHGSESILRDDQMVTSPQMLKISVEVEYSLGIETEYFDSEFDRGIRKSFMKCRQTEAHAIIQLRKKFRSEDITFSREYSPCALKKDSESDKLKLDGVGKIVYKKF